VNTENQSIENQLIVTAHAEFMHAAIAELQQFDAGVQQLTEFTAGICLCATTDAAQVMRRACVTWLQYRRQYHSPTQNKILAALLCALPAYHHFDYLNGAAIFQCNHA
jgi:hypothetical protein